MEPAPIEHLSILRAKSGTDVDKEIYAFKDKGGRDVGLRFDLTVGMTRYVCSRRDLRPPVKLACLGGVWRYDEPQHARYRWFRQWDLEIFGPPSLDADAEVIDASLRLFARLGIKTAQAQVGDRTVIQKFVGRVLGIENEEKAAEMMRALDKVHKKSLAELKKEYIQKGYKPGAIEQLFEFGSIRGAPEKVISRIREYGIDASGLAELSDSLKQRQLKDLEYNLGVVRGIDYYSAVVFEVVDTAHPDLGSLAGGGRYDVLPRLFGRPDLSATGAAGGMERIVMALVPDGSRTSPLVYVAVAGPAVAGDGIRLLSELRAKGISADASNRGKSLAKQLEDASRLDARWALIVGEKDLSVGLLTLRNMNARSEERLSFAQVLSRLTPD